MTEYFAVKKDYKIVCKLPKGFKNKLNRKQSSAEIYVKS